MVSDNFTRDKQILYFLELEAKYKLSEMLLHKNINQCIHVFNKLAESEVFIQFQIIYSLPCTSIFNISTYKTGYNHLSENITISHFVHNGPQSLWNKKAWLF